MPQTKAYITLTPLWKRTYKQVFSEHRNELESISERDLSNLWNETFELWESAANDDKDEDDDHNDTSDEEYNNTTEDSTSNEQTIITEKGMTTAATAEKTNNDDDNAGVAAADGTKKKRKLTKVVSIGKKIVKLTNDVTVTVPLAAVMADDSNDDEGDLKIVFSKKCDRCKKNIFLKTYVQHIKRCEGLPCPICKNTFISKYTLRRHQKIHQTHN